MDRLLNQRALRARENAHPDRRPAELIDLTLQALDLSQQLALRNLGRALDLMSKLVKRSSKMLVVSSRITRSLRFVSVSRIEARCSPNTWPTASYRPRLSDSHHCSTHILKHS